MTKKKKKKSEAPHDPFNEGVKDGAVDFEKRIRSAFSAGGPLAGATEHFMHRDGQLSFALDVARAIENHGTEVIEAGYRYRQNFCVSDACHSCGLQGHW